MDLVKKSAIIILFCIILPHTLHAENPHKDKLMVMLKFAEPQTADSNLIPVEFEFHTELSPNDSGIGINGSFNGWGDVYKLDHIGDNIWIRTLYLSPGMYSYKFVTYIDTVGQAGVTGWFTDPLNPEFSGPYRDSNILVKDPMIYYFLPVRDSEINDPMIKITAKMSTALKNDLVPESILFTLDNVSISDPWKYFDAQTYKFSYNPETELSYSKHNLSLSVENDLGASAAEMTTFTLIRGILEAPYTLTFDGKSPLLDLRNPVERVSFEWMDQPVTDVLQDHDDDGIFTREKNLRVNEARFYRVIVNQDIYLENDPTNPMINQELRSVVVKKVYPFPKIVELMPRQGSIYKTLNTQVTFRAKVVPSDSGYALLPNSARAWFDDQEIIPGAMVNGDTLIMYFDAIVTRGRHIVQFTAEDEVGMAIQNAILTVGSYPSSSGFHYVDGENDDHGFGDYIYPATFTPNSAEICAVHIGFTENFDSLHFKIEMEQLSDNTRIGFYILNSLEGDLVDAMDNIDIKLPDWTGRGVFASLADPSSLIYRSLFDNKFLTQRESTSEFIPLKLNLKKLDLQELDFTVATHDLEEILGTFNHTWYFIAYSYFVTTAGSYELDKEQGGLKDIEDPDIFDLAFCEGWNSQSLLLSNFIIPTNIGGPRLAAIGSQGRGAIGLSGIQIDSDYVPAPYIELLANGGDLFRSEVNIVGHIQSNEITEVTLHVNNETYDLEVIDNMFAQIIQLIEGSNIIYASAVYDGDKVTNSVPIEYNYIFDKTPVVVIQSDVTDNLVTLDGSGSFSPEDKRLRFSWRQDETNPQQVEFSSRTNAVTTFETPSLPGEYYFTLVATVGSNVGWGRSVIVVDDSAHTVDNEIWHPAWVDSMILYEIFVRTYDPSGKLNAVKSDLYSLKQQGFNCIWFMPIHPSPSTHGYWITDYYDINPDYGTLNDFQSLVQEAHKYGIKIIMDLVINHTADTHPFMLDALDNGDYSPYRDFYSWDPDGNFQYLYTWVNLPSINYSEPWVQDYLINMCKWWIQKYNIDGFRCDVAHAIEENRPEGPEFWQRWRRELKQMKPDLFLLAEATAADARYFDKKFDSAYDYWLYSTTKNALYNTANADDFRTLMNYYQTVIPANARPMRYIENHDESRLFESFSEPQTKLAAAIDFTLPGVPLIYAGQEVGELTSRGIINWSDPERLQPHYDLLLDLRRSNHALNFGSYIDVPADNEDIFSFIRKSDKQIVLVVVNLANSTQEANLTIPIEELPFKNTAALFLNDLLEGKSTQVTISELVNYHFEIKSYQFTVLEFTDISTGTRSGETMPYRFHLYENYPNPFNSETVINFSIGGHETTMTTLEVYNVLGQRVCTLIDKKMVPGEYHVKWSGHDEEGYPLSTGLYFCRIKSADYVHSIKMLLLK